MERWTSTVTWCIETIGAQLFVFEFQRIVGHIHLHRRVAGREGIVQVAYNQLLARLCDDDVEGVVTRRLFRKFAVVRDDLADAASAMLAGERHDGCRAAAER